MSSQLIVAAAMLRKAQKVYEDTLRKEYPVGAGVRWVYKQQCRAGVVTQHGFGGRLQVRNTATEKVLWIYGGDIVAAFATELGATA